MSIMFIGCLLTKFDIRSSKDSLFITHKLSVILFYFFKNGTVKKVPHFSKLCNHPAFHDVKVRGASANPTSQFRVSAKFLLLILVRGCPTVPQHSWKLSLK